MPRLVALRMGVAAALIISGGLTAATPDSTLARTVPASELLKIQVRQLDGQEIAPLRPSGSKAVVLIFFRTDCPLSNRYSPEIQRIHHRFAPDGIVFYLVDPDPNSKINDLRKYLKDYEYPIQDKSFAVIQDPQQKLVKVTGAQVTPEAAVYIFPQAIPDLIYTGRIDDKYIELGKSRQQATEHDLEDTLTQIVAGKSPLPRVARAIGCFISDLR